MKPTRLLAMAVIGTCGLALVLVPELLLIPVFALGMIALYWGSTIVRRSRSSVLLHHWAGSTGAAPEARPRVAPAAHRLVLVSSCGECGYPVAAGDDEAQICLECGGRNARISAA